MPSKTYEAKLLRFYMAGYSLVEDSNAIPSFRMTDTAYIDKLIDASEPYDDKLLCPRPELVRTIGGTTPRSLELRNTSACTMTSARFTKPASSICHYALSTKVMTLLPLLLCSDFSKAPHQNDRNQSRPSYRTVNYCSHLHRRQCRTSTQS